MKIKLMTDAPLHNHALMCISTYAKEHGHDVFLGQPQDPCTFSVASWLFAYSHHYPSNIAGGPGFDPTLRLELPRGYKPDYSLFPIDYSLGYTWEYCPRKCGFCVVPEMKPPKDHHSIADFLNPDFGKIVLLNNNTLSDPQWRKTFQEILDADLTLIDQNGYYLRLLTAESADYLRRIKKEGVLHFSWDRIQEELAIRRGLNILKRSGITGDIQIYVLVGYPQGRPIGVTDLYRCKVIDDYGFDPFVMLYNNSRDRQLRQFRRMVNRTFQWRKNGFALAWANYDTSKHTPRSVNNAANIL